jgi:hypothetical protein
MQEVLISKTVQTDSGTHLVRKLKICGAVPLLSLYSFMAWIVSTLPLLLPVKYGGRAAESWCNTLAYLLVLKQATALTVLSAAHCNWSCRDHSTHVVIEV